MRTELIDSDENHNMSFCHLIAQKSVGIKNSTKSTYYIVTSISEEKWEIVIFLNKVYYSYPTGF